MEIIMPVEKGQKRMVYAKMFQSEQFGSLSLAARNLFVGCIVNGDSEGRLKAHPAYLRSQIFPYDNFSDEEIMGMIGEMLRQKIIVFYEKENRKYFFHPNWERYQEIRKDRFKESILPPPDSSAFIIEHLDNQMTTKRQPSDNQATTKCPPKGKERKGKESEDKDLLRNKSLLKIQEKKRKAEEAKKWNDDFLKYWKEKIGESPRDEPAIRERYPRLTRQRCLKENIDYDEAMSWALSLINKKDGLPYWRGKLTTLTQFYHKIIPAFVDFKKQQKNIADYAAMKKAALEKTKLG